MLSRTNTLRSRSGVYALLSGRAKAWFAITKAGWPKWIALVRERTSRGWLPLAARLRFLRRALMLLGLWCLLDVSMNLRLPGPEPDYFFLWPSIDVAILLLAFALLSLLRCRLPKLIHWLLTGLLVFARLLRFGDGIEGRYFSRTFNLYSDLPLLPELVRLYFHTEPLWKFLLVSVGTTAAVILLIGFTHFCLNMLSRLLRDRRQIAVVFCVVSVLGLCSLAGQSDAFHLGAFATSIAPRLREEAEYLIHGAQYRTAIRQEVARLKRSLTEQPHNLAKLDGANVYLFLIESYGQTVIDRFHTSIFGLYAQTESELSLRGFSIVSSVLISPTYGGSSWLAHATLGTGVRTNSQFRYRTTCEAAPQTLAATFNAAGYHTVLAQPATTRPWPEGDFYQFAAKYYKWNFDYKGPRFSWAPMPDQYVVDFIRRKERTESRRHLFAQYALVSSHAPWNYQPPIIRDDSKLGDGTIYTQRRAITFPSDWENMSRAGDAYVRSIHYDLEVLRRYIAKYIRDDALVIIVGDHQPNGDITAHSTAYGVPIHVLSRKREFLEPFLARGYVLGMKPDVTRHALDMAEFFPSFVRDFSSP